MRYSVYVGAQVCGELRSERGRLSFHYAAGDDTPRTARLSVRLPVRAEPYDDLASNAYFANLLPEDEHRRLLAATIGISTRSVGPLLGAIGGECAGAVSIWPEGQGPEAVPRYEDLSEDEVTELLGDRGGDARRALTREGRLSLPGGMDKIALRRTPTGWQRAHAGAPTTHILKWAPPDKPDLSLNEHFAVETLRRAGVSMVETALIPTTPRVLIIRRFDRVEREGRIRMVHQEDFCQACGVDPALKYQSEGGPSLSACAKVLREFAAVPAREVARLLDWVVAGYMVGSTDGHAKPLALLHGPDGVSLSPFFDISSSAVYPRLNKLAMSVGGEYRFAWVQERHWRQLGDDLGVRWPAITSRASDLAERIEAALLPTRSANAAASGDLELHEKIDATVRRQIARFRNAIGPFGGASR